MELGWDFAGGWPGRHSVSTPASSLHVAHPSSSSPVRDLAACLDGVTLGAALQTATRWLEQNAEAVNALNVFPVPDGDTGLNMSLTLASANEQLQSMPLSSIGEAAEAMARGALMGSRGNSGVILAHILRGFARALAEETVATGPALARALAAGADAAYAGVPNPVEGTILTVARAAAESAASEASGGADVVAVLDAAHSAAEEAVANTPNLLPILRQASVVDAGGEGYRIFLQGLLMHLRGEPLPSSVEVLSRADLSSLHQDDGDFFGYCTEVLFQGRNLDVGATRDRLASLGTSVLAAGDASMMKIHVHTERPGAVIDLATELGELVRVKIDNMQLQHQQFAGSANRPHTGPDRPTLAAPHQSVEPGTSIVAVASGAGMATLFRDLGAGVVDGGPTMNPSVEDLAQAIRSAPLREVIVLPNNKNVFMAAEQARKLVPERPIEVVPTCSMAQGVAATLALNPESEAARNLPVLTAAANRCRVIEIATASRDVDIDGVLIRAGKPVALLDDRPAAAGRSEAEVLTTALARLGRTTPEAATIYVGIDGSLEGAEVLATAIKEQFGLDPDVVEGGQPHYQYVVCLEEAVGLSG
jgi:uncharacterized protein